MGLPEVILIEADHAFEPLCMGYQGQPLHFQGRTYPTAEHLFQCLKTTTRKDHDLIMSRATPEEARAQGVRLIRMRQDWWMVREVALALVLAVKFVSGRNEVARLLETGDALLVFTKGDRWMGVDVAGVPMSEGHEDEAWHLAEGLNWLGRLLMSRRAELASGVDAGRLAHAQESLWRYVRYVPPTP
jgi:predicted NAD-dependent protein-ADP-ribosyltransferase YbiA (DUF1768 family)